MGIVSANEGTPAVSAAAGNGPSGLDWTPVLAGVRRLTLAAEGAETDETVFAALARELIAVSGAEEVHIHHLRPAGVEEPVGVYLLDGDARLSYLQSREERPAGVSWTQSTGRSFLAVGPRELTA
jgi:hypothetical protein